MNVRQPVYGFKSILASLNCDGAYGVALFTVCVFLLIPELSADWARDALRYERSAIEAGQWWRLVTAHLVHLDLQHTLLNVLGAVVMWALFARDFRPGQWLIVAACIVVAVGAGLWFWDTGIHWYVGASGALHGFMAAGTLAHLRRGDLDGWILTVFLVLKLGYEQWSGALPFSQSDDPVVLNAHLYGAIGGLAASAFLKPRGEPL